MKVLLILLLVIGVQPGAAVGQSKREKQQRQRVNSGVPANTPVPSVQPISEEPKPTYTEKVSDSTQQITIVDSRSNALAWAAAAFNFLLLLIVGYQAYTNGQQLSAMRDGLTQTQKMAEQNERAVKAAEENAKIARESFYIGERPYFGVVGMGVTGVFSQQVPTLKIALMNGGQTPAWRLR